MIYQPTNVTPDLLGGAENGSVFVNAGGNTEISWSVNGNSPMVAYQIDFFNMGSGSTQTGTTGKVVLDEPFSAVDAYGNVTRFSVEVAYSLLGSAAYPTYEGKFRITQWWGDTDDESVAQRSLSVYRVVRPPTLSITGPSGYGGIYSFTGTVTLPSSGYGPVTAEWARWYAWNVTRQRIEQDTGKVYGATEYQWSTQRLNPGDQYYVVFSVGMSYGTVFSEQTQIFTALEGAIETTGGISVQCDKARGAVRVDVTPSENVPAITSGTWRFEQDGKLFLGMGGSAKWYVPAPSEAQWSFVWVGELVQAMSVQDVQSLMRVRQANGNEFSVFIEPQLSSLQTVPNIFGTDQVRMQDGDGISVALVLKNGSFYFILTTFHNGMPDNTYSQAIPGDFSSPVSSVTIGENTRTEKWFIMWGEQTDPIWDAMNRYETPTVYGPQVIFQGERHIGTADADVSYFGIYGVSQTEPGFTLMRRDENGNVVFVANIVYGEDMVPVSVWDYGAGNGHNYTYYVTGQADEDAQPFVAESEAVSICLWDWALIQTEPENRDGIDGRFRVVQTFLFSSNVSTGQTGNGANPSVEPTFTRFPAVLRGTQNRQSGTLTGLIGRVMGGVYTDSNSVRDAIWSLATSPLPLFLRNRRGDFLRVTVSGEIGMTTADNSAKQQISASVPWVEIAPAEDTAVTVEFQGEGK